MPTVSIRADGNHTIGLGHIYRARTLGLALADLDWNVFFHTLVDTEGEEILRRSNLDVVSVSPSQIPYVSPDGADIVLIDSLDTSAARISSIEAKTVTFDDTNAGLKYASAVINPVAFHSGKYKSDDALSALYEGPEYMILQPEIMTQVAQQSKTGVSAPSVLIACGGTDDHQITPRLMHALNKIPMPLEIRINLGPGTIPSPQLDQLVSASHHNVQLLRASKSLISEMVKSDFVLCAGGFMLYELAALGVPAIAIAAELHEIENLNYWESKGSIKSMGSEKTLDERAVKEAVVDLATNSEKCRSMSEKGKRVIDGRGLGRCISIIQGLVQ